MTIKISPALHLFSGTILEAEKPEADGIKEMIFGIVMDDDECVNPDVLRPLVQAYIALLNEESDGEEIELVCDDDNWAAEKLYRKFAIKGWRKAVGRKYPETVKSRSDEEVYEGCPWYEFGGKMRWPAQLIAEIGYLRGHKSGARDVAMSEYVQRMEKQHGSEWYKHR